MNDETTVRVTAPNGVTWTRRHGGGSTGHQLLQALTELQRMYSHERRWNWWQEGREQQEHDRVMKVLHEWDNGAPPSTAEEAEAFAQAQLDQVDKDLAEDRQRRADLVARTYDKDKEVGRLRLLRAEADAAFFGHVARAPKNKAQQVAAEDRAAQSKAEASKLRDELDDPERIIDRNGYVPAEKREMNLSSHVTFWRYPVLRDPAKRDRRRFNAVFAMPPVRAEDMCSECQAPAEWHEYDLSLQLFQPPPPSGSQAETIARLMPGWWEGCPACTAYKIGHVWGGSHALPDFDGDQWRAMLPPLLRKVFAPQRSKPKKEPQPKPLAVIAPGPISEVMARLADAQAQHPTAQVRRGRGAGWELWPPKAEDPTPRTSS